MDEQRFPSSLKEVSGEEAEFLQKYMGPTIRWEGIYRDFSMNYQGYRTPKEIVREIEKLDTSIPRAPLFLMLAYAYLCERNKDYMVDWRQSGKNRREELGQEGKDLHQAVAQLRTILEADIAPGSKKSVKAEIRKGLIREGIERSLSNLLDLLDERITRETRFAQRVFADPMVEIADRHLSRARSPKDFSPGALKAFDGVKEWIKNHWRKRGVHQETHRLFEVFEIPITDGAAKRAKNRSKKIRGTKSI